MDTRSAALLADRIGIVFAAREPGDVLQHISVLEVHGLRNSDARALLDSAVHFSVEAEVRDRIVAETRGNPLALLELPRGLTATQLTGGLGVVEADAVTGRIEESFVRRLRALSESRDVKAPVIARKRRMFSCATLSYEATPSTSSTGANACAQTSCPAGSFRTSS